MSESRITFEGGTQTLVAYGLAFTAILAVFVPLGEIAQTFPAWLWYLQEVAVFVVVAAVTALVVRHDGVRLSALGLSRRHLLPAIVAFGGIYVGLNVVGVGIATAFGLSWGTHLVTETVPGQFAALPAPWLLFVALQFFVGFVEELSFRGYLQTKVVAVLGGDTRGRISLGVVTASVVFGLLHAPGALLAGAGLVGVLGVVAARAVTGLFFGTFYELTRNVYFVALLHGLGNTWPLLVDWTTMQGTALAAFFGGVTLLYVGATVGYRHWASGAALAPTVRRTDTGVGVDGLRE